MSYAFETWRNEWPASLLHSTCSPTCGKRTPGAVRYEMQTFEAPAAETHGRSSIGSAVAGFSVHARPLSADVETSMLARLSETTYAL